MIATTNLAGNLDEAFERRFLYKIKFDKPPVDARVAIWQIKVPGIPEEDAQYLSGKFQLSGGQIENIARKIVTEELLKGEKPDLDRICEFCLEESLDDDQGKKRLGF